MALNLAKKNESGSVVSIRMDEKEFHNIFEEYYAALCSFAFRYMEDADMSADIVQDVFAKLWQIRDDFFLSASGESLSLYSGAQPLSK